MASTSGILDGKSELIRVLADAAIVSGIGTGKESDEDLVDEFLWAIASGDLRTVKAEGTRGVVAVKIARGTSRVVNHLTKALVHANSVFYESSLVAAAMELDEAMAQIFTIRNGLKIDPLAVPPKFQEARVLTRKEELEDAVKGILSVVQKVEGLLE